MVGLMLVYLRRAAPIVLGRGKPFATVMVLLVWTILRVIYRYRLYRRIRLYSRTYCIGASLFVFQTPLTKSIPWRISPCSEDLPVSVTIQHIGSLAI